ncbi:MAG: glycosyltransferase [Cryomorphaceae bacterium]|nr:glycosyltransferase [Cryomorphaceae bacterium]
MKTVVATTYAVNPYKGSEDGMGWNFVFQIARFHKVIAITRENNKPAIEKYMAENPQKEYDNMLFLYYDTPYWMRFWKRGGRGAMLYYLMWQRGVVSFIKKQKIEFDLAHNLNFHNDWSPSFLWKLKVPFVWGPVGHHPQIPVQYLKYYDKKHRVKDVITMWVKQYFWRLSPALRKTRTKADHIWCMNVEVPKTLRLKKNYSIIPSVATQDFGWEKELASGMPFTVISAGRFVPLKGFDLTLHAFGDFVNNLNAEDKLRCELLLVGSGPEEPLLRKIAEEKGITDYVKFISWIERSELMKRFSQASAFLFPSHEGAGMVVPEALSFGVPVICLDNEGPGQFINSECGFAIPHQDYDNTVLKLARALTTLYAYPDKHRAMRMAARKQFEEVFHWDRRGEQLKKIYSQW